MQAANYEPELSRGQPENPEHKLVTIARVRVYMHVNVYVSVCVECVGTYFTISGLTS